MSAIRTITAVRAVAFAGATLLLSACSVLTGSGPAPAIYDLDAAPAAASPARRAATQILVPMPTTSEALAGNRVAVRDGKGSIAYLPGVTWSDQLPNLVQSVLARSLEDSGRVKAVGKPGQSLAIDDQLIVDIRAFELDVAGAPTGHVALGVKLLDDRTGRIRASEVFDASVPASSDRPGDALRALKAATGKAMADVVAWTSRSL